MRKGDTAVLVLTGGGVKTAEIVTVLEVKKGQLWLDNGPGNDPTGPFDSETLEYLEYTVPGFSYELIEL